MLITFMFAHLFRIIVSIYKQFFFPQKNPVSLKIEPKSDGSSDKAHQVFWARGTAARYPSTVKSLRSSLLCEASLTQCPQI